VRVRFTDKSLSDLNAIADWIAQDHPDEAARFVRQLRSACEDIGDHPNLYPIAEGVAPGDLRRRLVRPYLIFYRVEGREVLIHAVVHGARDYRKLLSTSE
jgi:toxin ParE1/3/4